MKIHLLPLGARFEYEGEEFVKTGPMFGTGKDGGQRLIPKYAHLKVIGDVEPAPAKKAGTLAKAAVNGAFEVFYETSKQLVPEDKQQELEAARARFLKVLGLSR
jgi:hypothetical protein